MTDRDDGSAPGLRRASSAVAAGILLSRLSGLIREIVMARLLGTGVGAEAVRAALRVPNVLQNLLGEGVLSASFVPVYSQLLAEGRRREAGRLAGAVAGLLLTLVTVIVVLIAVFAEPVTRVLAWGFVPGSPRFELTVQLVRIVTPGVGMLVLSAWCLAILNAHRQFFLAYVAPVLWNAAIVAALISTAMVTLAETSLATALAWGAVAGSTLQFVVQVPRVLRLTGGIRPTLWRQVTGLDPVVRRFGQVLAGRGSVQLAGYVDLFAASLLAFGAVAALGYAQVLYLLPVSLFAMSVAASELPTLSTMDHSDRLQVVERLHAGLARVAFFVFPTTVLFVVAGDLVVALLFGGGRFTSDATVQVGLVLCAYAVGLPASAASRLLQSVLYGTGDARSPAVYAAVRVSVAAAFGIALMLPLDHVAVSTDGVRLVGALDWSLATPADRMGSDNLLRLGAVGLALGASVGAWIELTLLARRTRRAFGPFRRFGPRSTTLVAASLVTAFTAISARLLAVDLGLSSRAVGTIVVLVVGLVHLAVTRRAGLEEARSLRLPGRNG
ncbi:MAG: murein biosynthesis integral membrane protein MurJ [Nitriliruptoraceae bacterium]